MRGLSIIIIGVANPKCLTVSPKPSNFSSDAPGGQAGSCCGKMSSLPFLLEVMLKSCAVLCSSKQKL